MQKKAIRGEYIAMNIKYDIEKLKSIIDDLCLLTGLAIGIADTDFNYLYSNNKNNGVYCLTIQFTIGGKKSCTDCDNRMLARTAEEKKPHSHICHAGLCDTGVPITKNGIVVGYIVIGRVRMKEKLDEETEKRLIGYGLDIATLRRYYSGMTYLTAEQHKALVHLVSHLVFENAIEIDYDDFIIRAKNYIDKNLRGDLSVKGLCSALFVSKNYLYSSFRSFFGVTVNEYVSECRMQAAKTLLAETNMSAYEVAGEVGIENYTYFSKLFKKEIGISPTAFRKTAKKENS